MFLLAGRKTTTDNNETRNHDNYQPQHRTLFGSRTKQPTQNH